jgi:hypothetical protein
MQNSNNYGVTLAKAEELLEALEPFNTGTLSATLEEPTYHGGGHDYVVRSYGAIIAYSAYDPSHAFRSFTIEESAYNYSATTSKHANIVRRAWCI